MEVKNALARNQMAEVNEYEPKPTISADLNSTTALSIQKEAKAIEVAMITAKRFPRDMVVVEDKIVRNCTRRKLAEQAEYSFSRGGQSITGPSIVLMRVIAQCFGNIEYGINELSRGYDSSECEAYAWDFENNTKITRRFEVPHYRDKRGGKERLVDDRDIREMVMNFGSRNLRSCLESIVPKDVIDTATDICHKTLNSGGEGIADLIVKSKTVFRDKFSISSEELEAIIGVKYDKWTKAEYNQACKYYRALDENETTVSALKEIAAKNAPKVKGSKKEETAEEVAQQPEQDGFFED